MLTYQLFFMCTLTNNTLWCYHVLTIFEWLSVLFTLNTILRIYSYVYSYALKLMYCFKVIEGLLDEEKNKKLVRLWKCYKEFDMLKLQGCRGDDVYAYEKRYVSFIVFSILNGSIISYMINILRHRPCRIGFLATELLWLCSCCLGDDMVPYMHFQCAYALKMT